MLYKTNAAGGQPAARKTGAEQASYSAGYYNTFVSGNLLCDMLPGGRLEC
jgi:hypothetical protein